jgi:hypothetical protein
MSLAVEKEVGGLPAAAPIETFRSQIIVPLVTINTANSLLVLLPISVVAKPPFATLRVPPAQTTVDVAPPSATRNRPVTVNVDAPAFSVTTPVLFENVTTFTLVGVLTVTV